MPKQNILFMSGFPRAGSTLLINVLAQNPKFHCTPTSGLIGSVISLRDNWKLNEIYLSNCEEYVYPKIKTMMLGMINGFYQHELNVDKIPIDKNRLWTGNIDLLDELFETKVKFIYPIRHVVDCLISFEKMHRKSSLVKSLKNVNDLTTYGRTENTLAADGVLGLPIHHLKEILYRKEHDRLLLIPFDDLLGHPEIVFKRLYDQLEMKNFKHDFINVKQTIVEHDIFHGYAPNTLHKITEGKILSQSQRDLTIFDNDFINEIENERYSDITKFININTIK